MGGETGEDRRVKRQEVGERNGSPAGTRQGIALRPANPAKQKLEPGESVHGKGVTEEAEKIRQSARINFNGGVGHAPVCQV